MAKSDHGKKPRSTGVGESKNFGNPDAPQTSYLDDLHINGKRIGDHFTPEQIAMLRYEFTDEGIEERNAGKAESAARVTAGPFEKACEQRDDELSSIEPWEARDPMKELMRQHVPEGFRGRYLSPRMLDGRAGARGWDIVKDKDGNVVKLANMPLGIMPEAKARKRNKYYSDLAAEQLKRETEKQQEEQERSQRDSQGHARPLESGKIVEGRFGVGTGNPETDRSYDGNPAASIGLRSVRGNSKNLAE